MFPDIGSKRTDADRRSLRSRSFEIDGYVESKEDPLIQIVWTHHHAN